MPREGRYLVCESRAAADDTADAIVSVRTLRFATARKIFAAALSIKGRPGVIELWDDHAGHLIFEHYRPE